MNDHRIAPDGSERRLRRTVTHQFCTPVVRELPRPTTPEALHVRPS